MSQKIIIMVMGAIIAVGGGAWVYQTQMGGDASMNAQGERTGKSAEKGEDKGIIETITDTFTGSLSDLVTKGDSVQCSFKGIDPDTKAPIDGKVFVSGENMRLEADTEIQKKPVNIQFIQKGQVMYMWSDDENVMPPFMIDASGFPEEEKPESPLAFLDDPESGVKYKCSGWVPNRNSFEPPADIEFFDMFGGMADAFKGMMQEGMMQGGGMDAGSMEEFEDWANEMSDQY